MLAIIDYWGLWSDVMTKKSMAVKFCGLTNQSDIEVATQLGVSAVGLVFYPKSPRYVDCDKAVVLCQKIPAFTTIVALVVNMAQTKLTQLANQVQFDIIQFHGDETADECQKLANMINKRWIKAIRVKPCDDSDSILNQIQALADCGASGVILDTFNDKAFGGTGQRFDWDKIPDNSPLPIYLAGGLNSNNIGDVVGNKSFMSKIAGVDVSGGIERERGVKCTVKMGGFMESLRKL